MNKRLIFGHLAILFIALSGCSDATNTAQSRIADAKHDNTLGMTFVTAHIPADMPQDQKMHETIEIVSYVISQQPSDKPIGVDVRTKSETGDVEPFFSIGFLETPRPSFKKAEESLNGNSFFTFSKDGRKAFLTWCGKNRNYAPDTCAKAFVQSAQ